MCSQKRGYPVQQYILRLYWHAYVPFEGTLSIATVKLVRCVAKYLNMVLDNHCIELSD